MITNKTVVAGDRLRAMIAALRRVAPALCVLWAFVCVLGLAGCRGKVNEAHFRLENGLRVDLLATSKGDRAALAVLFAVGADQDPAGRSGMAHLVEHLFTTAGRDGKPPRTIEQWEAQYGHDGRAATGADYTLYAVEVPAGRILDEIDDAALRMSRLDPTESDLTRERSRLLAEIAVMQERDPMSSAMNRAAEALLPSRGGGVRGGVAKEIDAMTLPEVEAFRLAHYGGATARLVVAGRFDVEEVSKRIKAGLAKLPAGKAPEPRAPSASRVTGTLVMGDAPSAMALAIPVPEPKDPLYPAFLVLAARLAGPGAPARSWKVDFAPIARPDILFVTAPIPQAQQAEATAARIRAEVNAIVTAPLAADESDRALEMFGVQLGMKPLDAKACAAAPHEAAFAAGRRAQLGVDGGALAQAAHSITPEQVAAAAQLFDSKSSAAVIAGGKI